MRVLITIGTRPEAVKMAPVISALNEHEAGFEVSVCLTAQHREMLDQVIRIFDVSVDYDLNLMKPGQGLSDITSEVLRGMEDVLAQATPDIVLVHGDTTTSFAAALACYYRHVPAAHVEAGLRTHNKYSPFPEEINRRLGDALCDYHYAPTPRARQNLLEERIPEEGIVVTGNTVIDALLDVVSQPYAFEDARLDALGRDRRLILATAHRRESFGDRFEQMCTAMRDTVRAYPDVELAYPVHPNPNVRSVVNRILGDEPRVYLLEPLDYLPFVHLLKRAYLVLTDSGGIQEEAPSLGKPVLVTREVTERPEAVEAGTALIVGNTYSGIRHHLTTLLEDRAKYDRMARAVNPYGDGYASRRIADHLAMVAKSYESR